MVADPSSLAVVGESERSILMILGGRHSINRTLLVENVVIQLRSEPLGKMQFGRTALATRTFYYCRQHLSSISYTPPQTQLLGKLAPRFSTMSSSDFRLPTNVQPTHYDLTIKTDLKEEIFEGLVKIRRVYPPS